MVELVYHRDDGETFVWRFYAQQWRWVLRAAGQQAAEPENPLDWHDVAMLTEEIRRQFDEDTGAHAE